MAESAIAVTLEQYLASSYRPDIEFLDEELKEKPLVSPHMDACRSSSESGLASMQTTSAATSKVMISIAME